MAIRIVFSAVGGIFLTVSSVNATLAAVKKAPTGTATTPIKRGLPLTEGECAGLGGKVNFAKNCTSGQGCYTTDQDGVIHMACITSTKK